MTHTLETANDLIDRYYALVKAQADEIAQLREERDLLQRTRIDDHTAELEALKRARREELAELARVSGELASVSAEREKLIEARHNQADTITRLQHELAEMTRLRDQWHQAYTGDAAQHDKTATMLWQVEQQHNDLLTKCAKQKETIDRLQHIIANVQSLVSEA
jgi:chromosome segregation ATPase